MASDRSCRSLAASSKAASASELASRWREASPALSFQAEDLLPGVNPMQPCASAERRSQDNSVRVADTHCRQDEPARRLHAAEPRLQSALPERSAQEWA